MRRPETANPKRNLLPTSASESKGFLQFEGWAGTSAIWQLATLTWLLLCFMIMAAAIPLMGLLESAEWVVILSLLGLLIGWCVFALPSLFFALLLPVPALRGDRFAWLGLAACVANIIMWPVFWTTPLLG